MKKILMKIISSIASVMIIPSNCMAWTNKEIQQAYEEEFGTKYTECVCGLKAIIALLTGENLSEKLENSKTALQRSSISDMQDFLESNYENFELLFLFINMEELEKLYNKLVNKEREYDRKKVINALGDFDKNNQRFILEKISVALQTDLKNIQLPVLLEMATQIAESLTLKLGREEKRRKSVLLKWFDTNWEIINPVIETFTIVKT